MFHWKWGAALGVARAEPGTGYVHLQPPIRTAGRGEANKDMTATCRFDDGVSPRDALDNNDVNDVRGSFPHLHMGEVRWCGQVRSKE